MATPEDKVYLVKCCGGQWAERPFRVVADPSPGRREPRPEVVRGAAHTVSPKEAVAADKGREPTRRLPAPGTQPLRGKVLEDIRLEGTLPNGPERAAPALQR